MIVNNNYKNDYCIYIQYSKGHYKHTCNNIGQTFPDWYFKYYKYCPYCGKKIKVIE